MFIVFGAVTGICVGHSHGHGFWWAVPDAFAGAAFALLFYFVLLFVFVFLMWLLDRSQGGTTTLFPPRKK
jgi:hypothetical protein